MLINIEQEKLNNIINLTALELSSEIKKDNISVAEAVGAYLMQISRWENNEDDEKNIHAFISVFTEDDETLLARIDEVQQGIASGRYTSKLAGVPIAMKDNICTKGIRTTCGSKMLENFVPTYDAEVVRRLEEAGMIIIGKTNMDEFAMGSTTESSYFGVTKNPHNMEYVPGGSSGGSCAAVAAGEVPLALGSDTGGSIRQPASYCGVTGFKPSYGRVSRSGLIAYVSSMDQIGPIARNVADCAALYEIIEGYDQKDSTSYCDNGSEIPSTNVNKKEHNISDQISEGGKGKELQGKRIGVPEDYLTEGTSLEVRAAIDEAIEILREAGAAVETFSLKYTEYVIPTYYIIACAEASSNLERYDGVKYGYRAPDVTELHEMYKRSRTEGFGEEVKRRILLGSFVLSAGYYDEYYIQALKVKRLIKEEYDETFKRYDAILAPVAPTIAPKLGAYQDDSLKMYLSDIYTVAVNLAGLPAISLPWSKDSGGLPIGVQLIGNIYEDEKLLELAQELEELRVNSLRDEKKLDQKGQLNVGVKIDAREVE